ncbi:hypothetical protein ACJMK2_025547 [Sinanodonta woodiana]|uniref:WAP domain-containing protein n=1 Tax=Sinanodonta woodiana TaxID=1069815 RepID=A0ABD3XGV5_SINWO
MREMALLAMTFILFTLALITTGNDLYVQSESGFCTIPAGGTCQVKCETDVQCRTGFKCCFNGCGYHCVKPSGTPCSDGSTMVHCLVNPCDVTDCPAHPEAVCVANYCGGCNAIFFVGGKKVNCKVKS